AKVGKTDPSVKLKVRLAGRALWRALQAQEGFLLECLALMIPAFPEDFLMHTVEPLEARIAPATIYALDNNGSLLSFDSDTPGTVGNVAIPGLGANHITRG